MSGVKVVPVPALSDNYMYLIIDLTTKKAGVIDPVDPAAIQQAASKHNATIDCILTTHSHWDHDGGNQKLVSECPSIQTVYGGKGDGVSAVTKEVGESDVFYIGDTKVSVLFTPCHTQGHVCYYVGEEHVFTGDTLFVSGCGNFNTGTPRQMMEAIDKILMLPDETQVWVGHEYTANNCRFATFADPDNKHMEERLNWALSKKAIHGGGTGTIPSTIGKEKMCNPFCRIDDPRMIEFCGFCTDRSERMRLVRKGKDDW
eukprot:CAMPEP_0195529154 /NCGR_PEP_ID=MMETSP0794_2-20130614/31594_1 /TAXON_ID=515487 /ORGANISM="Stephanopyxis turris, Strain CCMP 815" /LENGTH=257 /DNA_ID=CAMNT_0040660413 /DNA_START=72 /DNA_END=842 /DNA_ORIENTATION=+